MFADELDELGTYWLEKLPNVSFEETLLSCLTRRPYGMQPGHASFYYPKRYGYGEVWLRMAGALGTKVLYGTEAAELCCEERLVRTKAGEVFAAQHIVTTVPWQSFERIDGMPEEIRRLVPTLRSSAIETRYVPKQLQTEAQWIYEPDLKVPWHRILVRHNFCPGSRGYWLETRESRVAMFEEAGAGFPGGTAYDGTGSGAEDAAYHYLNAYAYPLNTIGKPEAMEKLLAFCEDRHIHGLGRWGEHCHYNSDVVVELAMQMAEKLAQRTEK